MNIYCQKNLLLNYNNCSNSAGELKMIQRNNDGEHMLPQVSIIIPIYNVEKYIAKCLDSIAKQNFADYELILINDGSTDDSLNICSTYAQKDSRIIVFSQKNQGVSTARNKGLDLARGKYIVFIDGDDWVEAEYLSNLVSAIISGKYDIAICGYSKIFENGYKKQYLIGEDMVLNREDLLIKLFSPNYYRGYLVNKIFIHELIKQNSLRFDTSIYIQEDLLFICKYMVQAHQGVYINQSLYNYLQRENSALHIAKDADYMKKRLQNHNNVENSNQQILNIIPRKLKRVYSKALNQLIGEDIDFCLRCAIYNAFPVEFTSAKSRVKKNILTYLVDFERSHKSKIYGLLIIINWRFALLLYKANRQIKTHC